MTETVETEISEGEEYSICIMNGDGEVLTECSKESHTDMTAGEIFCGLLY